MKKNNHLVSAIAICIVVLLCSCHHQMYSYRKTISVTKNLASNNAPVQQILPTEKPTPSPVVIAGEALVSHKLKVNEHAETTSKHAVINDIKKMIPEAGSLASGFHRVIDSKAHIAQMKTLKRDLQKAEKPADINGRRWMVIGAILLLIGLIISLVTASYLGYLLGTIGFAIFVIGLIFFLIDNV